MQNDDSIEKKSVRSWRASCSFQGATQSLDGVSPVQKVLLLVGSHDDDDNDDDHIRQQSLFHHLS